MVSFYKLKYSSFISSGNLFIGSVEDINPNSKFLALGIRRRHVVSNLNYSCFMSRRAALFLFGALSRKARPLLSLGKQFVDDNKIMSLCRLFLISYVRNWVPGLLTNYGALSLTLLRNEDAPNKIGCLFKFPDVLLMFGESYDIARISKEARLLGMPTVANIGSVLNIKHFTYVFLGDWSSYDASKFFLDVFFSIFVEARRFRTVRYFFFFKRFIRSVYLRRTLKLKLCVLKFVNLRLLLSRSLMARGIGAKPLLKTRRSIKRFQPSFFEAFAVGINKRPISVRRFAWFRASTNMNAPRRRRTRRRFSRLRGIQRLLGLARLNSYLHSRLGRSSRFKVPRFVGTAPDRLLFRALFPFLGYFGYGYLAKRVSSFFFFSKIFKLILQKRSKLLFLKSLTSKVRVLCRSSLRMRALKKVLARGFRSRRMLRKIAERSLHEGRYLEERARIMRDHSPEWRYKKDYINMMRNYYKIPRNDYWKYFFVVPTRDDKITKESQRRLDNFQVYKPYDIIERVLGLDRRVISKKFTPAQRDAFSTYIRLYSRFPRFVSKVEASLLVSSRLSRAVGKVKRSEGVTSDDILSVLRGSSSCESRLTFSSDSSYPVVPEEHFSYKYQRYIKNRKDKRMRKGRRWRQGPPRNFYKGVKPFGRGKHFGPKVPPKNTKGGSGRYVKGHK